MKIGIIHYSAPPIVGGVEIVIHHHLRFLTKSHQVHLIYGYGGNLPFKNLVEHNIPLLFSKTPEIEKIQENLLKYGKDERFEPVKGKIKKDLIEIFSGLDCCIVHNLPSMPFNFVATAAINEAVSETGIRAIYWVHDIALVRKEWRKKKINSFPFSLLHYKADNIKYVTISKSRARELSRLPPPFNIPDAIVIPNGIDSKELLKEGTTKERLKEKLRLSDHFTILTPVRITERKNIEFIFKTVHELKVAMSRPIRLVITGPPDFFSKTGIKYFMFLENLIKRLKIENEVFLCCKEVGVLSHQEIVTAYKIADLVFIASKEEGFGLPIIEAAAAGKPIFCSRIPPFEELSKERISIHLFSLKSSPKTVASRIARLFERGLKIRKSKAFLKKYDWEEIVKRRIIPMIES
jgi:glycosyltransferase involved in cell wall biosynthesis